VRRVHDFVRDVRPSYEEWEYAIAFLTRTGQISGARSGEVQHGSNLSENYRSLRVSSQCNFRVMIVCVCSSKTSFLMPAS
jgi:hypothetical protein